MNLDGELNDDEIDALRNRRGCDCAYLGSIGAAPCSKCTSDLTLDEALELGFVVPSDEVASIIRDQVQAVTHKAESEKKKDTIFSDATKRMCG